MSPPMSNCCGWRCCCRRCSPSPSSLPEQARKARARATLPGFLIAFALLVLANSFGLIPHLLIDLANDVSRWCLVTAIAALGMKTSFKDLFAAGWRPVGLMLAETAWIAVL